MNKKVFFIIIGWCLVISALVIYNIFPLLIGKEVMLEIRPVDPRDLLRGDYVTLDFNISHFDYGKYVQTQIKQIIDNKSYSKEEFNKVIRGKVFVVLKTNENNIAEIDYVQNNSTDIKGKLYITGEIKRGVIKYGIESYFVKEKTGREIERKINSSSKSYAKVKIAPNGKAKVIGLELNKEFNK